MKATTRLIGDRDGSQGPATSFGWRALAPYSGHAEAEARVAEAMASEFGVAVKRAGDRTQSHDLEIVCSRRLSLSPGLYEVKSLYRKAGGHAFDRRFKVGTRGERIYGRRDSQIKAFALALEDLQKSSGTDDADMRAFVERALLRKHSKGFNSSLMAVAGLMSKRPGPIGNQAEAVLLGAIGQDDVLRGFNDIEGIFVVAGPIYTLVTKAEMGSFLSFDSASSEGPKLRMLGVIPSETNSKGKKGKTKK